VTDFDCWHQGHEAVTVDQVMAVMAANSGRARALVRSVVPQLGGHEGACRQGCERALDHALITAPEARDPAVLARLDAVAGRVLKKGATP
ncbi:MAG: S-methyl-5'-thioadenosine phosphorylase, partial [Cystobacter sp.]